LSVALHITNLGKKFGTSQIFKSVNLNVYKNEKVAILGSNGSGKSTLLKIISGFIGHQKGEIKWVDEDNKPLPTTPEFSYSAPYIDLFDFLTVNEQLAFHFKEKKAIQDFSISKILEIGMLQNFANKQVRQLSSGVRQRLKNTIAVLTDTPVLFLDEPCSNLDKENINLYQELINTYCANRIVLIASNYEPEYEFICTRYFKIENQNLTPVQDKQLWA
jgi:ABC-type multidrug transport system ATPase subunit